MRLARRAMRCCDASGSRAIPSCWICPCHRVLAHERVAADAGLVAVERGPLVYCVEGVDNDGHVLDLALPDGAALTPDPRADLLGGMTVLRASAQRITIDANGAHRAEPFQCTMIPYYTWNHRGEGPMAVWLPRSTGMVRIPYDTSS
jgi:DUF1680 family protein